ncbi:MAG: aminoacyl-tRNA hydrolase [Deltaproteobacteria bacterium]|nr:aminoacyl-tRNA hydrolase [Deltaproteobacteria bacterium]
MRLVAGLGNPGEEYAATRHNVGFAVVELLAERWHSGAWSRKFRGLFASAEVEGERRLLLKPQTYMNLSGESIQAACAFYRVEPGDVVAVHDDIDFELGRVQVKFGGGHGGHKGIGSTISHLGRDFARVRLGVGRPAHEDVVGHVLGGFRRSEQPIVVAMVKRAADAVEAILRDGVRAAQNAFNVRADDDDN